MFFHKKFFIIIIIVILFIFMSGQLGGGEYTNKFRGRQGSNELR